MKLIPMLLVAGAVFASTASYAQTRVNPDRSADVLNARVLEVLRQNQVPAPAATVPATTVTAPAATSALNGVYLGAFAGSDFRNATNYQLGGQLGYQFRPNWAGELTYDYKELNNRNDGQMVLANVVYSRRIGESRVTPYALMGAGVGWNAFGANNTGNNLALYNVGAGVRVNLINNLDLDARYRVVGGFTENSPVYNVLTGGLALRF